MHLCGFNESVQWLCERKIAPLTQKSETSYLIYYTHFEITGGPCNLTTSNWCDLFTNRTIFALNRIFSPANEEATLKTKQPIRFQGLFKETNQIAGKMKDKEYHVANFATFVSKTLIFPPKIDEFNFKPAQHCINKIFELTKSCI